MKKPVYVFCLLFTPLFAFPQQSKIDSLLSILKTAKEDTNKVNILNALGRQFIQTGNYDTAFIHAENAKKLARKINFKKGIANSYGNIGIVYKQQGDYPKAFDYYLKALKIDEELKDKNGMAKRFNNIGNIYLSQSDSPKALEYYFKTLKMNKELLEQAERSENPDEIGKNKNRIAATLGNIGLVYHDQGDYPKALEYHFKALKINEDIGNKSGSSINLGNIGNVYYNQSDYSKALEYYFKALKINEDMGNKNHIAVNLGTISSAYIHLKKYNNAYEYLYRALALSNSIGAMGNVIDHYRHLSDLYEKANIPLNDSIGGKMLNKEEMRLRALHYFKRYMTLRDTLFSQENKKQLVRKEMNYEFDKKESLAKAEQDKKDALANEEKRRQKIVIWSMIVVLLLIVVFSVFMFNRWRVTKKQKKIIEVQKTEVEKSKELIEEQKKIVEEKNKDITDSINYAQRIQRALLASNSLLTPALKGEFAQDYFILFKPKDIVSGDFYWATKVESEKVRGGESENHHTLPLSHSPTFFLAVCDSTGHGVPGAFMSLLNISFLNEAINEEELVHPNEIFNHVRQRLIENISSEGAKDGMDGILLKFQVPNYKSQVPSEQPSVIIEYAASNNAPVLINSSLQELDCDNMPVGISDRKNSFTLHAVPLPNGKGSEDWLGVLYLFTDGFADQFGGHKDKKFKTKLLKQKLMEISHLPMEEQKKVLEQTFNEWKGSREQTDDVLVVGIKI